MSERPDFREPWGVEYQSGDLCSIFNREHTDIVGHCFHAERIVECVNACAGMEDPAATIAQMREALEFARLALQRRRPVDYAQELITAALGAKGAD